MVEVKVIAPSSFSNPDLLFKAISAHGSTSMHRYELDIGRFGNHSGLYVCDCGLKARSAKELAERHEARTIILKEENFGLLKQGKILLSPLSPEELIKWWEERVEEERRKEEAERRARERIEQAKQRLDELIERRDEKQEEIIRKLFEYFHSTYRLVYVYKVDSSRGLALAKFPDWRRERVPPTKDGLGTLPKSYGPIHLIPLRGRGEGQRLYHQLALVLEAEERESKRVASAKYYIVRRYRPMIPGSPVYNAWLLLHRRFQAGLSEQEFVAALESVGLGAEAKEYLEIVRELEELREQVWG